MVTHPFGSHFDHAIQMDKDISRVGLWVADMDLDCLVHGDIAQKRVQSAECNDVALIHDCHAVTQLLRLIHEMRGENNGLSLSI